LTQQELKQTENYKDKHFANLESYQINNKEEPLQKKETFMDGFFLDGF
jgi:hypothetical protein